MDAPHRLLLVAAALAPAAVLGQAADSAPARAAPFDVPARSLGRRLDSARQALLRLEREAEATAGRVPAAGQALSEVRSALVRPRARDREAGLAARLTEAQKSLADGVAELRRFSAACGSDLKAAAAARPPLAEAVAAAESVRRRALDHARSWDPRLAAMARELAARQDPSAAALEGFRVNARRELEAVSRSLGEGLREVGGDGPKGLARAAASWSAALAASCSRTTAPAALPRGTDGPKPEPVAPAAAAPRPAAPAGTPKPAPAVRVAPGPTAAPKAVVARSAPAQEAADGGIVGFLKNGVSAVKDAAGRALAGAVAGGLRGAHAVADLVDVRLRGVDPPRRLTAEEAKLLREVYGGALNTDGLRLMFGSSAHGLGLAPHTVGNTIYLPQSRAGQPLRRPDGALSDAGLLLIHEAGHGWQSQNGGSRYLGDSLWHQFLAWHEHGDRNVAYDWRKAMNAGKTFKRLNPEQQCALIQALMQDRSLRQAGKSGPLTAAERSYGEAALAEVRAGRGAP